MRRNRRRILDHAFTAGTVAAVVLAAGALVSMLGPIVWRGSRAFVFRGTVGYRRLCLDEFERGDNAAIGAEWEASRRAREPLERMLADEERAIGALLARVEAGIGGLGEEIPELSRTIARRLRIGPDVALQVRVPGLQNLIGRIDAVRAEGVPAEAARLLEVAAVRLERLNGLKARLRELLGPLPGDGVPVMLHSRYGSLRWDQAKAALQRVLYTTEWRYEEPRALGRRHLAPRSREFVDTPVAPLFDYLEAHAEAILQPRWTFYGRFLTDTARDNHRLGGIRAELAGTLALAVGALLLAVPLGLAAAIYLAEYAGEGPVVGALRICISTLAGIPGIVLGLFGVAFFLNTVGVSEVKSVLAGSLTLALLVLPTIIRTSETAIRSVPADYRDAALALGACRWQATVLVVLPAALRGIVAGWLVGLGRAAGETAAIMFTAVVSVGSPIVFRSGELWSSITGPTTALPWSIYMLSTEHPDSEAVSHMLNGMVLVLAGTVLMLNLLALIIRSRPFVPRPAGSP